jgi:hypothetical protein
MEMKRKKIIDNHLKEGAKDWAKRESQKDANSGKQNNIDGFINFLWEPLKDEGFEFTYHKTKNSCQLRVSKCPIAEIASKHHIEKWGYKFHCMNDDSICEGYNPMIKMKRTKTKMEGHEYCDHFYYIE